MGNYGEHYSWPLDDDPDSPLNITFIEDTAPDELREIEIRQCFDRIREFVGGMPPHDVEGVVFILLSNNPRDACMLSAGDVPSAYLSAARVITEMELAYHERHSNGGEDAAPD